MHYILYSQKKVNMKMIDPDPIISIITLNFKWTLFGKQVVRTQKSKPN